MATPLSPANSGTLNFATPPTSRRFDKIEMETPKTTGMGSNEDNASSSPFVADAQESDPTVDLQENVSPIKLAKSRHSRILSGNGLSPLKLLSPQDEDFPAETQSPLRTAMSARSPRKVFPEKRFPVRVNSASSTTTTTSSPDKAAVQERDITLEDAIHQNAGLAKAIQIFEDEETMFGGDNDDEGDTTTVTAEEEQTPDEPSGPDDTMVSTFSTFSAVPNMTMFARIGHSPTKLADTAMAPTPRARKEPSPSRNARPPVMNDTGNTTNLLMDFTEQIGNFSSRYVQQTPSRRERLSPSKTTGSLGNPGTPARQMSNLIDFDIPPMPTPRSIPTITPRELESLKSNFLSEISSLKASLSGKEAEVSSLKTAVVDAEKRVGTCMEQLREERASRETLAEEKESWERRGREMESVLRKVKEEIMHGQREQEELEQKLDESEKRREAAEIMAQEAESKMAGMRAGKAADAAAADSKSPDKSASKGSSNSREVEIAVERVARELHALYKSKHETKVQALKKSYENRWEKKVRELESRVNELAEDNDKLRLGRDATLTKVDPNQAAADEERKAEAVKNSAHIKEMGAEIEKLEAVLDSVKNDNDELRVLLEKERVEKGELVILAEEMMSMQQMQSMMVAQQQTQQKQATTPARSVAAPRNPTTGDNRRTSIGRASGLRAPGPSKIGGLSQGGPRGAGGIPRPGSGLGARSGIMSSIEKMGNYRGRGE